MPKCHLREMGQKCEECSLYGFCPETNSTFVVMGEEELFAKAFNLECSNCENCPKLLFCLDMLKVLGGILKSKGVSLEKWCSMAVDSVPGPVKPHVRNLWKIAKQRGCV